MPNRPRKGAPKKRQPKKQTGTLKKKRGRRKDVLQSLRCIDEWCVIDPSDPEDVLEAVKKKGGELENSRHTYLHRSQLGCEQVFHCVLHEYMYGDPDKCIKKLRKKLNKKTRSTQSLFSLMNEKYLGLKGATNSRAKSIQEFAVVNHVEPQDLNQFIYKHGGYTNCAEKASAFFQGQKPKSKSRVPRVVIAPEVREGVRKLVGENDFLFFKAEKGEKSIQLKAVCSDELLQRAAQKLLDKGQIQDRFGDWS